jgi:hypothetical protein
MGNFPAFCVALLAATAIGPVIQHLRLHGAQRSYDTSNHNPPAFTFIDLNPTNPLAHFEFDCSRGQVWQVLQCDTLSRKFATRLAHHTNIQHSHIRISLSPEHSLFPASENNPTVSILSDAAQLHAPFNLHRRGTSDQSAHRR